MKKYLLRLVAVGMAFGIIFGTGCGTPKKRTEVGVPAPTMVKTSGQETLTVDGKSVKIDKKYIYEASGIVRMINRYKEDSFANKVSPLDMGLIWGSAAQYNDKLDYRLYYEGRGVVWTVSCKDEDEIDLDVVMSETAFGCVIPQNDTVREQLKNLKKNDYVKVKGYLVNSTFPSGADSTYSGFDMEDDGYLVFYLTEIQWLD